MGIFNLKQFAVCDDGCAMKVGTDGVLLGAWADISRATNILDIGTGSGIIALMLAQRSDHDAKIDAIELLEADALQAKENISKSPWPHKVFVIQSDVRQFNPSKKYDLIVCNPPFFSKSLLPPSSNRSAVRHDIHLTSEDLIATTIRLMGDRGTLCLILPTIEGDLFISKAANQNLFVNRITRFFARAGKTQERSLIQFGFSQMPLVENSLTLYTLGDQWSNEYAELTREFYLDKQP